MPIDRPSLPRNPSLRTELVHFMLQGAQAPLSPGQNQLEAPSMTRSSTFSSPASSAGSFQAAPPPPRRPDPSALVVALTQLTKGVVPALSVMRDIEAQIPTLSGSSQSIDYVSGLRHISALNSLQHGLAHLSGSRPTNWRYPDKTPFAPRYGRGAPQDRSHVGAFASRSTFESASQRRNRACFLQPLTPDSSGLFATLLTRTAQLSRTQPEALQLPVRALHSQLARCVDALAHPPRGSVDSFVVSEGLEAAHLALEVGLLREAWGDVERSMRAYCRFAATGIERRYQATPMLPTTLHRWLDACPGKLFPTRLFWQPGMEELVDHESLRILGGRIYDFDVPTARLEHAFAQLAERGHSFDFLTSLQLEARLCKTYAVDVATAEATANGYVIRALEQQSRRAVNDAPKQPRFWSIPAIIVADATLGTELWPTQLLARLERAPLQATAADVVHLLAIARQRGDMPMALRVAQLKTPATQEPTYRRLVLQTVWPSIGHKAKAYAFSRQPLTRASFDPRLAADAIAGAVRNKEWQFLQRILERIDGLELLMHSAVIEALAQASAQQASSAKEAVKTCAVFADDDDDDEDGAEAAGTGEPPASLLSAYLGRRAPFVFI